MTAILGLNAHHGDAAAALLLDGELVAAAEEERFNRVKHCAGFPALAAAWCLEAAGLRGDQLDHVAIGRDPRANAGAKLARLVRRPPRLGYLDARVRNASRVARQSVRATLAESLGLPERSLRARFHAVEHHQAHVASAFFPSPFEEAAVISIDGFGDFASTMLARGNGNRLELAERVLFPDSLGIFYTALTQWLGFRNYGDEGKVMGLAPYGDPERFLPLMRDVVEATGNGLFRLNLAYFTHHTDGVAMSWKEGTPEIERVFSGRLEDTLGPARDPGGELSDVRRDVAAALQSRLEEIVLHLVGSFGAQTDARNLCLAGGVALNAVANGRILPESGFDGLYVQPAAGDSGTAVGAAFHVWNQRLGMPRSFVMSHAYFGPRYDNATIAAALEAAGLEAELLDEEALCRSVAEAVASGAVVGWFQGAMELGPRALGNRSILADPRRAEMKDILNARIKHHEPFRPFAPSIRAEATGEWFDQSYGSPFMVVVYRLLPGKGALVPAITHIDGTGRLQTVEQSANPLYYRLLTAFDELTGVPILLNTSFNENEPIVMSPEQAIETFLKTHIDLLALGNYLVRRDASAYTPSIAAVAADHE